MIQLKNICLQYGEQTVFDNLNLTVHQQDRIGLVGRNGSGKSTLLKIVAKQLGIDSGHINISGQQTIAYMPQEMLIQSDKTVLDEAFATFDKLQKMIEQSNKIEQLISQDKATADDIDLYSQLQHEILQNNPEEKKRKAQSILQGLQFDDTKLHTPVSQLSVGWRMRLVLAKLLLQEADFYLFDEPTNHLDLATKEWFLQFLQNETDFGFLLVCHDRYFLDKLCKQTFALQFGGRSKLYQGNYTTYQQQEQQDSILLEKAYEEQQKDIKQKQKTIERFRSKSSKAKMAQSMIKQLEKIDLIEIDKTQKSINFALPPVKRAGHKVLHVHNVAHKFNHQIFDNISFEIHRGEKVALVAPNGTGKTTLFNIIANKLKLQTGTIEFGYNVDSTLFDQDQEKVLNPNNTILEEVQQSCNHASEAKIRSFLGSFLFPKDDVLKYTKVLSGGERNRVAMVKVLLSNANFLLLDEPTNHLDIESKEIVLQALQKFDGTILFVSHDQDFVNHLATKVIELTPHNILEYKGNYDTYLQFKHEEKKQQTPIIKESKKSVLQAPSIDRKALFTLQKKCRNLETKIDKMQNQLQELIASFYQLEYGSEAYNQAATKKQYLEEEIASATTQWESLQTELDTLQK